MTTVTPMKYHGPGWSLTQGARTYQVWGPGEIVHDGIPMGRFRDHWSANYQGPKDDDGNFVSGATLQDVLRIFPVAVQKIFWEAIVP